MDLLVMVSLVESFAMVPWLEVIVMVSLQEDLVFFFLVVPRKKDLLFVAEMAAAFAVAIVVGRYCLF